MECRDKNMELSAHLIEELAEAVHNEWADERRRNGWNYGKRRNDALKQHPCLVVYDELSEEEREYDRRTALRVIETLRRQGYKIVE